MLQKPLDIPSQDYLRSILDYDSATGVFWWKWRSDVPRKWNTRYAGTIACSISSENRVRISIHKTRYKAHRIAWVYVHGSIPDDLHIDHIDGNTLNNRIANLRPATHSQNAANSVGKRRLKGAYPAPKGRWRAYVKVNGKQHSLGQYDTEEQAHNAYRIAAREHFGEYARA